MSGSCKGTLSYSRTRPEQHSAGAESFLHGHRGQSLLEEGRRRRDATPPHSPIHCMAPLYLGRGRYVLSALLVIKIGNVD